MVGEVNEGSIFKGILYAVFVYILTLIIGAVILLGLFYESKYDWVGVILIFIGFIFLNILFYRKINGIKTKKSLIVTSGIIVLVIAIISLITGDFI